MNSNYFFDKTISCNNDWLSGYFSDIYRCEYDDIVQDFTSDFLINGEDFDKYIDPHLKELPDKYSDAEETFNEKNTKTNDKNCKLKSNIDIYMMTDILRFNKLLSKKTCKKLAINLITCFGSFELAFKGMESASDLKQYVGLNSHTACVLRTLRRYAIAVALCHITIPSPATAEQPSDNKLSLPKIDSGTAMKILASAGHGEDLEESRKNISECHSLVTDRDVLVGLWWVYWSMARLRDSLTSSSELSFMRAVLTERAAESTAWLRDIKRRCSESYEPESVRMISLPKSSEETRNVPVIPLGDKVALMALYASVHKDIERIDGLVADYSYKYPKSEKIDSASKLSYVPRAFLYKYLSNYLNYTKKIESHLNDGQTLIQTDIVSFVKNITPELLLECMRYFDFDPSISNTIFNYHKTWNCQDENIGVPFGNSLTTAGMKIVLCRIHFEMQSAGYSSDRCFGYADDFVLVGATLEDATDGLRTFDRILARFGLERNEKKTLVRLPDGSKSRSLIEDAINDAFAEVKTSPSQSFEGRDDETAPALEGQESLTLGGETEPAIEANVNMATLPQNVLRIIYKKHVKTHFEQNKAPEKGIANFTLYRMIKR